MWLIIIKDLFFFIFDCFLTHKMLFSVYLFKLFSCVIEVIWIFNHFLFYRWRLGLVCNWRNWSVLMCFFLRFWKSWRNAIYHIFYSGTLCLNMHELIKSWFIWRIQSNISLLTKPTIVHLSNITLWLLFTRNFLECTNQLKHVNQSILYVLIIELKFTFVQVILILKTCNLVLKLFYLVLYIIQILFLRLA